MGSDSEYCYYVCDNAASAFDLAGITVTSAISCHVEQKPPPDYEDGRTVGGLITVEWESV